MVYMCVSLDVPTGGDVGGGEPLRVTIARFLLFFRFVVKSGQKGSKMGYFR